MSVKRFTSLPITLYRIQPRFPVRLRDKAVQTAKQRTSFDLELHNGLVLPSKGDQFQGPNGMSLRPSGPAMFKVLNSFSGSPLVIELQVGLRLPSHFVLLHEHSDHYSLQTTEPVTLDQLNERMTEFLQALPAVSREEFFDELDGDLPH
eukprot:m.9700 g.9700  ORF g.9700 m.9700 type:complete len:149 (-) comp5621_c0_seq1:86-532(-)